MTPAAARAGAYCAPSPPPSAPSPPPSAPSPPPSAAGGGGGGAAGAGAGSTLALTDSTTASSSPFIVTWATGAAWEVLTQGGSVAAVRPATQGRRWVCSQHAWWRRTRVKAAARSSPPPRSRPAPAATARGRWPCACPGGWGPACSAACGRWEGVRCRGGPRPGGGSGRERSGTPPAPSRGLGMRAKAAGPRRGQTMRPPHLSGGAGRETLTRATSEPRLTRRTPRAAVAPASRLPKCTCAGSSPSWRPPRPEHFMSTVLLVLAVRSVGASRER